MVVGCETSFGVIGGGSELGCFPHCFPMLRGLVWVISRLEIHGFRQVDRLGIAKTYSVLRWGNCVGWI